MCGRYTLSSTPRQLAGHFQLDAPPRDFAPRYNIAPSQQVAIIRQIPDLGRHLDWVRWGLIPSWAKDPGIGNRLINARAETVAQKPAFRAALRQRRCLIAADGFYEWKVADGAKQPYWIGFENRRPLAFAGLWEHWEPSDGGDIVESCTIITTQANRALSSLHARMPVILAPTTYTAWLDPRSGMARLHALMAPFEAEPVTAYPVSRNVNNPQNDVEDLLSPVRAS